MKYHVLFLIVVMLVCTSCSLERSDQSRQQKAPQIEDNPTLSLGMSHELALAIIRECGGQDVTQNQAVVGPHGEWPLSDIFWNLEQYNTVLGIGAEDGKVIWIQYWTPADFDKSKDHRDKSKIRLKSLTFKRHDKTVATQVL